ncbi:hypothetical protein Droror1_Dr00012065 [Drosera rotundifolia]
MVLFFAGRCQSVWMCSLMQSAYYNLLGTLVVMFILESCLLIWYSRFLIYHQLARSQSKSIICSQRNLWCLSDAGAIFSFSFETFQFGPVHMLEDDKDCLGSMDWNNWTFCNGAVSNAICKEASLPSVFDAVVGPLRLDDIYKLPASSKVSNLQGALVNRYLAADEGMPDVHSKSLSLSMDKKVSVLDLPQVMETNPGASNLGFNFHNDVFISSYFCFSWLVIPP